MTKERELLRRCLVWLADSDSTLADEVRKYLAATKEQKPSKDEIRGTEPTHVIRDSND